MNECIFCKIINKELPVKIEYEDDEIIAFNDIEPQAPIHVLVIPKKHIVNNLQLKDDDLIVVGKMFKVFNILAKEKNINESGFRIVNNCLKDGGQSVDHIHFHLLGGRSMQWPPG